MKTTERTIHFYDLYVKPYTLASEIGNAAGAPLQLLIERCMPSFNAGLAVDSKGNTQVQVEQCIYDSSTKSFHMLINRADKNVSDVTFRDFNNRKTRKGGKTKIEGIENSCHIIIRPNKDKKSALLLMTMGAGVSPGLIERLLNVATVTLRRSGQHDDLFKFAHPSHEIVNGKPVTYNVRYQYNNLSHKSTLLDAALKTGEFLAMDLISHPGAEKFDANATLMVEQRSLQITAVNPEGMTAAGLVNSFKRYLKMADALSVDDVRISFKNEAGKTRSQMFKPNELDAAFTRKETIQLASEVDAQQSKLNSVITSAMAKLL